MALIYVILSAEESEVTEEGVGEATGAGAAAGVGAVVIPAVAAATASGAASGAGEAEFIGLPSLRSIVIFDRRRRRP